MINNIREQVNPSSPSNQEKKACFRKREELFSWAVLFVLSIYDRYEGMKNGLWKDANLWFSRQVIFRYVLTNMLSKKMMSY